MKEELYIDVVSKTIISQLSESIAQLVGSSVKKEIMKVLLTKLPGVLGDKIASEVNNALKDEQKATEKSEKRVLNQLKDIQGRVDKNVQVQEELLGGTLQGHIEKIGTDVTSGLENMREMIEKKALDMEEIIKMITAGSNKVINVLGVRIREIGNEKFELFSSLNEEIAFAGKFQVNSRKDMDELNAKIDRLEKEKADQALHITRNLERIDVLTKQMADLNLKLKESELMVDNAGKEKVVMEKKINIIQELWEKQLMHQETF